MLITIKRQAELGNETSATAIAPLHFGLNGIK